MAFSPEQKARFAQLERSGYLPMLREWILRHSAAFFWHDHGGNILHNGTVCFVHTGQQQLAITADHVYAQYASDLEAGRVFGCQFGGVLVRPEHMLIERTSDLDIATFSMPAVALSPGTAFHFAPTWPPSAPRLGEWMFYAGFPGAHRIDRENTLDVGLQTILGPIRAIHGSTIVFELDFEQLHWPFHDRQEINRRLGGMSGGPVFRLIERGLTRLEFVGIVCEHGENFHLVFCRSASALTALGQIAVA